MKDHKTSILLILDTSSVPAYVLNDIFNYFEIRPDTVEELLVYANPEKYSKGKESFKNRSRKIIFFKPKEELEKAINHSKEKNSLVLLIRRNYQEFSREFCGLSLNGLTLHSFQLDCRKVSRMLDDGDLTLEKTLKYVSSRTSPLEIQEIITSDGDKLSKRAMEILTSKLPKKLSANV